MFDSWFSLENETSFNAIYNYYAKMAQYRNIQEVPLILVGTQGEYLNKMVNMNMSENSGPSSFFLFLLKILFHLAEDRFQYKSKF